MSCPGDNYIVPGANPCAGGGGGTAGVTSLNTLSGGLSIVPGDQSIVVTPSGNQIAITATGIDGGVTSINTTAKGNITIGGSNATNVTTVGSNITINTIIPNNVSTLNGLYGQVFLTGGSNTTVSAVGNTLSVNTPNNVSTLNGLYGGVSLVAGSNTSVSVAGNTLAVNSFNNVSTLNGLYGGVTLSPGSNIGFNTVGNTITLNGANNVSTLNGLYGGVTLGAGSNTTVSAVGNTLSVNTFNNVSTLNGLYGGVTLSAGNNISLNTVGNNIAINASGGSSGVSQISVVPDIGVPPIEFTGDVVFGNAAAVSGLSITAANNIISYSNTGVHSINNLSNNVTLTAGTNITFNSVGQNITINASGGSGTGTSISQGGSTVECDATGNISLTTATNNGPAISGVSEGDTLFKSTAGSVELTSIIGQCSITGSSAGNINLQTTTAPINLNTNLSVNPAGDTLTFAQSGGVNAGKIVGISEINGTAYPPSVAAGVASLNGVDGTMELTSTDGSVIITPDTVAHTVNLAVIIPKPQSAVTDINTSATGSVTISGGNDTQVVTLGSDITINANYIVLGQAVKCWTGFSRTIQPMTPGTTLAITNEIYNFNADLPLSGVFTASIGGVYKVTIGFKGFTLQMGTYPSVDLVINKGLSTEVVVDSFYDANAPYQTNLLTSIPYIVPLQVGHTFEVIGSASFGGINAQADTYYISIELYKTYIT